MLITCSECEKKLKVSDATLGKKVRCPHCKATALVPRPPEDPVEEAIEEGEPEPAPPKKKPAKPKSDDDDAEELPKKKLAKRSARDEEDEDEDEEDDDALRCAKCNSAAIEKLPPNVFSRNPGFACTRCNAVMRPPGSTGVYLFVVLMGSFLVLFGLTLFVAVFFADNIRGRMISGAAGVTFLGLTTAVWGFSQMRLPIPRNAPPFRWLLWIGVTLVILFFGALLIGGCLFGFAYFLQEMMGPGGGLF